MDIMTVKAIASVALYLGAGYSAKGSPYAGLIYLFVCFTTIAIWG